MTTNDNHLAILQKWKWQLSPPLATRWPFTDRDQNGCCTNHWSLGHSCQWSFYSLGAWNGFCAWRKWRILSCLFKIGWLQNQRFSGVGWCCLRRGYTTLPGRAWCLLEQLAMDNETTNEIAKLGLNAVAATWVVCGDAIMRCSKQFLNMTV
jgi:hypothetical protein